MTKPATVKTATSQAEQHFTRIVRAMCWHPELLTIEYQRYETNVLIQICAHPNDSRIMVGPRGAHLSALSNMANLLWRGSHKLVQIPPIESVETPDEPYRKFSANADWPEKELVEHLVDLTRFVFTEAHKVEVESILQNDWTSHFEISITPTPNESALRRFSSAVAILFVPIGCRVGRMIYANVRRAK